MKLFVFLFILVSCCAAQADCSTTVQLEGFVSIKQCSPASGQCIRADEAMFNYMNAKPDDGPTTLSIATHSSPWHLYDGDYRILEIEELAAMVRQQGSKIKRVILVASWSGIAPDSHSKSLAQKLSEALDGLPVTGQNGFVWVSPKGALHTTHQAFTGRVSGPYWVGQNDQVMASLVPGWAIDLEAEFVKAHDAAGLLQVGIAKDIFMLCPDGALKSYDAGAALNSPIAAFNAAIMRLERDKPGDAAAAVALLKQSAAQGDKKAEKKLNSLIRTSPAI
ncbi:SEL1-like repeat protein [Rugamonas aquatica]|uniref:Uncharacterized protein n=1 Tax=Rugamonas aquatica TaxID=2743357 RepID=A0A6A7N2I2_9BURK|nr:hypothetical protein [Rugamonas aquatica]MQA39187.1 hypothetical protein [Rugamonas aquatica]